MSVPSHVTIIGAGRVGGALAARSPVPVSLITRESGWDALDRPAGVALGAFSTDLGTVLSLYNADFPFGDPYNLLGNRLLAQLDMPAHDLETTPLVRDLAVLGLCALVIRQIYRPYQAPVDLVREHGVDDPAGGVFDGAPHEPAGGGRRSGRFHSAARPPVT